MADQRFAGRVELVKTSRTRPDWKPHMPHFTSEDLEIAYAVYGDGKPVVLVHGFASNGRVNWVNTGWVEALVGAGYQAITIDNRGHGDSAKIYDPERYSARDMARDVANLIGHLQLGKAAVMGYSMGARITAFLALDAPDKVAAVVFGGLGINMVHGLNNSDEIAEALTAPSLDVVTGKTGRQFRRFAESTGSDLEALAACIRGSRYRISEEDVRSINVPALVVVGSEDDISGDADALAKLLPRGEALTIARRDHMRATGDPLFKQAVIEFLDRVY